MSAEVIWRLTPSVRGCPLIKEPHSCEPSPLRGEGHSVTQERRGPCKEYGQSADDKTVVSLGSTELGELHTPVQGTQEGKDDRPVGDLDVLEGVQVLKSGIEVESGKSGLV